MKVVERHIISQNHPLWSEIDHYAFLSKNLFNLANYHYGSSRFCVISLTYYMIDQSLCPLCLCGSLHSLASRTVSQNTFYPPNPKEPHYRQYFFENSQKLSFNQLYHLVSKTS
ncbi:hypothetical protein C789_3997 [Microcystis aeruginosa FACHB-905 = DIANCHI905]|uniref:Genome sequencing data, contig C293 n=1 Tax=Microcystis aeruginosa (strain PCC 7806) TaxID=267872 RepID=A8YDM5_MICA7|nr:hypothetical protein C789_3997 [Microcystis aeruginosa FACHB-905 = DIANCHI905]CAO90560.1 unnamed protein product [Microcystis aeruginosa PCC 7806]